MKQTLPNADVAGRPDGTLPAIRFGTDGWRARIAGEFTFSNLARVAQAFANFINKQHQASQSATSSEASAAYHDAQPLVVVGYDRRFMSEEFALHAAQVIAGNNIRIHLFHADVPTPLVSWAVRDLCAAGGVMITASHNPPDFNGFKIKAAFGGSAPPEITRGVEQLLDADQPRRAALIADSHEALTACVQNYKIAVSDYVDLERLRACAINIVVDSMHGSGGKWIENFLVGERLQVETIRCNRDPLFGGVNPEPIDSNLCALKNQVQKQKALIGLATDGDADRLGAVNEQGATMTMHEVVPLMLLHLARNRGMAGGVVRTFSQSVLTRRIAEAHNLKVYETPIGFKYVADLMLTEDILIGAEESGGIGVRGHIPERDGLLNSLLFLEAIVDAGKTPSEMVEDMHSEFGAFYFGRADLHAEVSRGQEVVTKLAEQPPSQIAGERVSHVSTLDGTKLIFADESWLLFRQSGTEPVLRIYAEATSTEKMHRLLEAGQTIIHQQPNA